MVGDLVSEGDEAGIDCNRGDMANGSCTGWKRWTCAVSVDEFVVATDSENIGELLDGGELTDVVWLGACDS